jgi:MFS family permease
MENEGTIDRRDTPGMAWRTAFSIMTGVIWLSFVILWLFFAAQDYTLLQNLGIFLLTGIIGIAAMAGVWASYGMRFAPEEVRRRAGWRVTASAVTALLAGAFGVAWLLIFAQDFNGYQNLAVLAVDFLVFAGTQAAIWVGMKKYAEHEWGEWDDCCH